MSGSAVDEQRVQPQFGVVARMRTTEDVEKVAIAAERGGFDLLGVGDSQSLGGDVYLHLAAAARVTRGIRLSSCVTNVVTRHPAVSANAIATVDRISGGRAILGVSVGDSAVRNLGLRPARLRDLRADIVAVQALMHGREAVVRGGTARLKAVTRPVPVYMAAEGPRALRVAGEVADGVFVGVGLSPELIEDAERRLLDGMTEAGRSSDAIEIWHMARCVVDDDRSAGLRRLRPALASIGHHGLTTSTEQKHVPEEIQPLIRQLGERYQSTHHVVPGESPNALLIEELGLVDYLADRFAIYGSAAEFADRVLALLRCGVRNVLFTVVDDDPAGVVARIGAEVLPLVRDRLDAIAIGADGGGGGS